MARASGTAMEGLLQGGFLHTASGVRYKVFSRDGRAWMSYDRDDAPEISKERSVLDGEKELLYFIGSGHRGRTYLYEVEGEWFEIPINFYGKRQLWDMAPNYGSAKTMPAALPVDSNCLHCHASSVQIALPGARNRYEGAPFLQGGIGCSACHGEAAKHLEEQGRGPIVNPAKLDTARRDSACLQCHLEGNVAIYRARKSLADFRVGDDLADYVVYSVRADAKTGGRRASSQYEALLRSACKAASGDKLTCTTCHDPHRSPSAEERVNYFREKCLTCHTGVKMATAHHPEQRDCAVCHMPTREAADISHEQVTDHDIQRHPHSTTPIARLLDTAEADDLVPVGRVSAGDREMGLAYAQLAASGNQKDAEKALRLLLKAEREGSSDVELHTKLGLIEQMSADNNDARREYAASLKEAPYDATALGNLAILDAVSGHTADAVSLLQRAIDADPSQLTAGLNLAFIECRVGNKKKALQILTGLTRFDPDDPTLRKFLSSGTYAGERCSLL
ncbi:tetratricopeptide repeat protein [Tunturiibacter empetritectus]|uniref:CXXCH cytochrome family protein n=2 Tax=Tunturiibacter TaxID=3154218 RepID=A0A852VIH0_9BACT|nr:tetratricopeptide repeat protein [Edaphobacter lichenicola]NYF90991.1 putative CXXCH cytochrome family protein [Edaphobacter lichenicola]